MFTDTFGQNWYKVGLHIHTTLSDGRKTPEEMAEIYKNAGYDAVAITDHWVYSPQSEINGLPIISGCEYNLGASDTIEGVMHIVGLGMQYEPKLTPECDPQTVIDSINNAGGLAVLAHPAWSLNTTEQIKNLKGFFATEIYNTVSNVNQSDRPYSGYFVDLMANLGIYFPLLATDDVHYYNGDDETKSFVYVKAESNQPKDILAALQKGDFYASQGPTLSVEKENRTVHVKCSPCEKIVCFSNASITGDHILRGKNLTGYSYNLRDFETWIRVEVTDEQGNVAYSNFLQF